MPWQFIKHHVTYGLIKDAFIWTMMGRESTFGSTRVTSATLHLHVQSATNYILSISRHDYPRFIAGTNLQTLRGWIAWWARTQYMHIIFAQGYYIIEFEYITRKWTQVVELKTNSIKKKMDLSCQAQDNSI